MYTAGGWEHWGMLRAVSLGMQWQITGLRFICPPCASSITFIVAPEGYPKHDGVHAKRVSSSICYSGKTIGRSRG